MNYKSSLSGPTASSFEGKLRTHEDVAAAGVLCLSIPLPRCPYDIGENLKICSQPQHPGLGSILDTVSKDTKDVQPICIFKMYSVGTVIMFEVGHQLLSNYCLDYQMLQTPAYICGRTVLHQKEGLSLPSVRVLAPVVRGALQNPLRIFFEN